MGWIIYNKSEPDLCWSTGSGWNEDEYDTFDDIERANLRLPMGGAWEQVPWDKKDAYHKPKQTAYNPMTKTGDL